MAWGDSGFTDTTLPRRGRGGGGNLAAERRRPRRRNRAGNGGNGGGGGKKDGFTDNPFAASDVASGDPYANVNLPTVNAGGSGWIDTPQGSEAAGDDDNYRATAWGILNQAGISNTPTFGRNQSTWLDREIDNLWTQWSGLNQVEGNIATDDLIPWDQFLYGQVGAAPPDLAAVPRRGRPGRAAARAANQAATEAWRRDVFAPAAQRYFRNRFAALSPSERGEDPGRWAGPKRTISY